MLQISALLPAELAEVLQVAPPYRGRQIFSWIHKRLVFDFASMNDLPVAVRRELGARARPVGLREVEHHQDRDGSVKFRFALADDEAIEAVLLTDRRGRRTACLSTQAGCAMGCLFCRTGSLGWIRDLEASEIVDQFLLLRSRAGGELASVVFMGMGEPLANLENLQRAVQVMAFSGYSPRRITISTCGLIEGVRSLGQRKPGTRLAVSLISADPQARTRIMPITRANPLPELRESLVEYQQSLGKRITLEIVLMAGVSDRPEDVEALVGFVKGCDGQPPLKVLVNLIAWNPLDDFPFQRPEAGRVDWFQRRIRQAGIPVTTRLSRGSAVSGSCGQLG